MKLLHTADWHVGRHIRGRSRAEEHEAVLTEITDIARREQVDAVLVCGDLFDSAAPLPEAERIVYRALLELADTGAHVVVIAGNHDNDRRLAAVEPLLALGSVTTRPLFADLDRAVVEIPSRSGDETLVVATIPFLSQRYVVRAADLIGGDAADAVQTYEFRYRRLVEWLCGRFRADTVNVLAGHAFVHAAEVTGSERAAHLSEAYGIPTTLFPATAHYVALGHLHRAQTLPGPCPIAYSGSPLQLDFGEAGDQKSVTLVDAHPGRPASIERAPLTTGRSLRVLRGTLDELRLLADAAGEDLLRVHVRERLRVGLADEVRDLFPNAVDVLVDRTDRRAREDDRSVTGATGRTPAELFDAYLAEKEIDDPRLAALFAELVEEVSVG